MQTFVVKTQCGGRTGNPHGTAAIALLSLFEAWDAISVEYLLEISVSIRLSSVSTFVKPASRAAPLVVVTAQMLFATPILTSVSTLLREASSSSGST